jgi:SpoVK/Ycf46/Vps4 family AAA+-type ATPase
MDDIVMKTPGYVGADINALIDEAIISSLDRKIFDEVCAKNGEKPNCKHALFFS